jgi:hypothetical protein
MALIDYLEHSREPDGRGTDAAHPWGGHPAREIDPGLAEHFAQDLLDRLEGLPPPDDAPWLVPVDTTCALTAIGGGWGVYGVGVLGVDLGDGGRNRLELVLDPAWLDVDFRAQRSRVPWMLAGDAEWATLRLRDLLALDIPYDAVLRASLPPEPYIAPGDVSSWPPAASRSPMTPTTGTLGPAVVYTDQFGNPGEGYLTAGHVVPPHGQIPQVDLQPRGAAPVTLPVASSQVPGGLGTGLGHYLRGAVDAAIIDTAGLPLTGVGAAGAAGRMGAARRVGAGSPPSGFVTGYALWLATKTSAWSDCYTVASKGGSFAGPGDSGAAVLSGSDVIGIVVGGAATVPGCPSSMTYVQDIATISTALQCSVVP